MGSNQLAIERWTLGRQVLIPPYLNRSFIYVERGGMALDVAVALAVNVAVAVLIVCGSGCLLIVG